ncbi:MAG: aminopeptidase N, partial [Bdellovibrionales bacterium]
MATAKLRLSDYSVPSYEVLSMELDFDLNENQTRVINHMRLKKLKNSPLQLNGELLKLIKIELDGKSVPYVLSENNLTIDQTPDEFSLLIENEISPINNTALEGLYFSKGILATQCEATGFRRITYFFDRPDVMTQYQVTLRADKRKHPQLLSNGDCISAQDLPDGRHEVVWKDPFKKPCYLFALVAGDMGCLKDEFITQSGRPVKLEIYCPHGKESQCEHAMNSLKKAMRWDEEKFGCEYDLSTYMIVAIDYFNMGAIENKGLNVFNSNYVFAHPRTSTDTDYLRIESIVAHEYFHNWTGNRITCRDWFHLALKEGLTVYRDQEFSSDVQDRSVQRIHDVDTLRSRQFPEDAGPNSHPVRPDEGASMDNFYTATIYEKGAEIISMMKNWLGEKTFRQAMDLYFTKYDGQAITIEEFISCMQQTSGKDFSEFKKWYHQSGTPHVSVECNYHIQNKTLDIELTQKTPPTANQSEKSALPIPFYFSFLENSGKSMEINSDDVITNSDGRKLILLKNEKSLFHFKNVKEKPTVVLNEDFSAPVILHQKNTVEDLTRTLMHSRDGFSKREAAFSLVYGELDELVKNEEFLNFESLKSAYQVVMRDQHCEPLLKAELLSFPTNSLILQRYSGVALEKIESAIHQLQSRIAEELKTDWKNLFLNLPKTTGLTAQEVGLRKLEDLALSYWSLSEEAQSLALVSERALLSPFMTSRLNALQLLLDRNLPFQNEA